MNNDLLSYKQVVKQMKDEGVTEKEFQKMMERGEITVLARNPDTNSIMPFRVEKIHANGKVEGEFLQ